MRRRNRYSLGLIVLLALASMVPATVAWGGAAVLGPVGFQSNGASISGWYWLRGSGHAATWTFDAAALQGAKKGSVYIDFNPLVTNGVNGGSGYQTTCKVTVEGTSAKTFSIPLTNPYRPVDPGDSGGVGYQCHGHSSTALPASLYQGVGTIKVTISYPFPQRYHVAVNRDAMYMGYSK